MKSKEKKNYCKIILSTDNIETSRPVWYIEMARFSCTHEITERMQDLSEFKLARNTGIEC